MVVGVSAFGGDVAARAEVSTAQAQPAPVKPDGMAHLPAELAAGRARADVAKVQAERAAEQAAAEQAERKAAEKAAAERAAEEEREAQERRAAERAEQEAQERAAAERAAERAAAERAAERDADAERASRSATRSGSARSIAADMVAARGWSSAQFDCLDNLWAKESNWRVSAENPSSSAYGIPQALPGSKMSSAGSDWRSNPATQIEWGLGYISSRYGNPCAAWEHSRANNWY
jgi:membrane protein involved in colicin uptake